MLRLLLFVKYSTDLPCFYFSFPKKKWISLAFLLFLISAGSVFADGSKELTANGGYRAFLASLMGANPSFPFPGLGTMKVYAKPGETIYMGSSAQGIGAGKINLRAPDGSTYTSGSSVTIGLIANRAQELAGPLLNSGGYNPFIVTVLPGQEGVWEVDFIAPNNVINTNPSPILANAAWNQPSGAYIAAFDVSVRNSADLAFIPGRVYCNLFSGILGSFDVGFNAIFNILTRDGYQYTFDNNGQAGNGFSFFANNKGFRTASGAASYKSIDALINPNIQDPRTPDTQSDITHKLFFNPPATDLPVSANVPGGGTTWLLTTPVTPTITNNTFRGREGSNSKGGTYPVGGNIEFDANQNGSYQALIDVNNNSIFTDPVDRKLTGTAVAGPNKVFWDGLDGLGNKVPATGTGQIPITISVSLFGGEVHFPFFDVERNVNGIKLIRINGAGSPDNTIYWDDSPVTLISGTKSDPVVNLTGINSLTNGHKWGTAGTSDVDFGNENGLDTWAYISSPPLTFTASAQLQESDLEVVSLSMIQDCPGNNLTYTIAVKNNGPDAVTGAQFHFNFPVPMHAILTSSDQTLGISAISSETTSITAYDAVLNMANGAVRTFTISAGISSSPLNGILSASASMMRPADVTDPDASNPDAAPPTDPVAECNSLPSGTGCNNIKLLSTTYGPTLNAGPDQTVVQRTIVTMAGKGAGTWTQLGSAPSIASITNPSSPVTTISGLNKVGTYTFILSDCPGCTDQVNIIVTFSGTVSVPNIFTPNGDGNNDVFEITGIDDFPGSQLIVFNRWGNEVYHSENYLNTWDGSKLTEGTYFYVLQRKESSGKTTPIKGWVYLKR